MQSTLRLFRTIILLSLACVVASIFVNHFAPGLVPEPLRLAGESYAQSEADSASTLSLVFQSIAWVGLLAAYIVGFFGMLMFKPWARSLNVALAFSSFVVWPLVGYNLASGWSQAFTDVSLLLWGGAISMAYFSPVSERFTAK
jgi:hypothetical protein